ncbi:uncharacterized protein LOC110902087 [Helianthus annuus]|nr:uncharacterized protein LOC110902087 [Helianthus annuus]
MAPNASQTKFSLKLMVNKEEKRVIFAEADSNFVDTLFSIMTLPMATIVRLLRKLPDGTLKPIGSLNNLYQSLLDLSMNCMSAEENKWMLLNPRTSSHDTYRTLKLNINDEEPTKFFICQDILCSRCSGPCFSTCNLAKCKCGKTMNLEMKYEELNGNMTGGVFVSDLTSYIVTDDLRVMPNSPDFIVQLLCELGVTDVSSLEEKSFGIGIDQILNLLEGALLFKHPLTYLVFPSSPIARDLLNPRQETSVNHLTRNESFETLKNFKVKVTMQKSTSKFLFAEADSDFVEFLFGFLQIPLGTMIGDLMDGTCCIENLNNMFKSISNMSVGEGIKSDELKNMLLRPQLVHTNLSVNQIFPLSVLCASKSYCHIYEEKGTTFAYLTPSVGKNRFGYMFRECSLKDSRVEGQYLKAFAKFMLTDDLVVTASSSFSSITMLGTLKIPLNDFEVHTVSIGIEEGLEILDASLMSVSPMTDSILKKITEAQN